MHEFVDEQGAFRQRASNSPSSVSSSVSMLPVRFTVMPEPLCSDVSHERVGAPMRTQSPTPTQDTGSWATRATARSLTSSQVSAAYLLPASGALLVHATKITAAKRCLR